MIKDEFDDIIDEIKKYFKLDSDKFDVDFLFIPESENKSRLKPDDKKVKGIKISYHFETGMGKPEIRIEGNIDEKKIQEYLEGIDIAKYPSLKKLLESKTIEEIDVSELSLESNEYNENLNEIEPHTEINDYKDYTEIVLEIPGISEEEVIIDISEEENKLIFKAKNENRKYIKNVYLPFIASTKDYNVEVKNGLAIILIKKSES